jgi:hypothetical protein
MSLMRLRFGARGSGLGTFILTSALAASYAETASPGEPAEARAIAYLAREVPRWRQENACYSCHNNGDAARALIVGVQRRHDVRGAIDDTLRWLAEPARWDSNPGGKGGSDDKRLARIQFASATVAASTAALVPQPAVDAAAAIVAGDQRDDGSWRLDSSTSLGSPATYGTPLATAFALRVLAQSGTAPRTEAIARGRAWLRTVEPVNVPDAVAVIFGLRAQREIGLRAQREGADGDRRRLALDFLKRAQGRDGGWGAYATTASEPFDTAIAMLALNEVAKRPDSDSAPFSSAELKAAIARGREFLIRDQMPDGSWPETTRPAHQESYAQRISTTAWAVLALMRN